MNLLGGGAPTALEQTRAATGANEIASLVSDNAILLLVRTAKRLPGEWK